MAPSRDRCGRQPEHPPDGGGHPHTEQEIAIHFAKEPGGSTPPSPDSPRSPGTAASLGWTPLLNVLSQGVILRAASGFFLEANPAASRILGIDRETLLGLKLTGLLARLHTAEGADLPLGDAAGQVALNTGQPVGRKTIGWVRADGSTLWLEVSAESVSPEAVLVSFDDITSIAIMEDITEQRRSEANQRTMDEQLKQYHKMKSLGQLAGGIAHDMNNVLGAILGLASAHRLNGHESAATDQAFDTISRAAVRGGKMVSQSDKITWTHQPCPGIRHRRKII
jgi:PAS domain S-box-containing protein